MPDRKNKIFSSHLYSDLPSGLFLSSFSARFWKHLSFRGFVLHSPHTIDRTVLNNARIINQYVMKAPVNRQFHIITRMWGCQVRNSTKTAVALKLVVFLSILKQIPEFYRIIILCNNCCHFLLARLLCQL